MASRRSSKEESSRPDIWKHIGLLKESAASAAEKTKKEKAQQIKKDDERKDEEIDQEGEGDGEGDGGSNQDAEKENEEEKALKVLRQFDETGESTYLLFVGSKGAGKSTLVNNIVNPGKAEEKTKPTVALEYSFGRRTNSSGDGKDICQLWELGGGEKLREVIPIVLTQEREANAAVIVTVDLSKPHHAFVEAVKWTNAIRKSYKKIPLIIVANKYDMFENQDGVKRKAACLAFRYLAFEKRAGLIFMSRKDKNTVNYARSIIGHYAFRTEKKRSLYVDPNKPIIVAPGRDKLEKIGLPTGLTPEAPAKKVFQAWGSTLAEYFPEQAEVNESDEKGEGDNESKSELSTDDAPLELAPEPVVDARKKQKDGELEQYRAQVARKLRLEKGAS